MSSFKIFLVEAHLLFFNQKVMSYSQENEILFLPVIHELPYQNVLFCEDHL